MRWHKLPLYLQIIFASSLVLLVTLSTGTWWNIQQQRQQLLDDITLQASGLARTASLASRYMVIAEKLDELESMLISLAFYPDLIELVVMNKEGMVLSDVHASSSGPRAAYDKLQRELPPGLAENPREMVLKSDKELTIWQPIQTSALLGWVMLKVDLAHANEMQQLIMQDNLKASGVVLLVDLFILLLILYLPGKSFRKAVHFAQHLTEHPGETLNIDGGSYEVSKLIEALNVSSLKLKQQRNALDRQTQQLEELNHHLEQRIDRRTQELAESRGALSQLHQAVRQSSVSIIMLDHDFNITECNPAFQTMTGHQETTACGANLFKLVWSDQNPPHLLNDIKKFLKRFESWSGETLIQRANGDHFWVQMVITPAKGEDRDLYYLLTMDDIAERKAYEEQLIHQARYDSLTGLPNRVLGMDRLKRSIQQDQRLNKKTVLMYLDLDRFKQINDTLGHRAGDLLLIEMAGRLTGCVRQYDTVSRLSGDEFMIVLADVDDAAKVESVAEKILQIVSRPFSIEGRDLHVRGSIGIAVIPDDGTDPDELLRYADTAMYQAKQSGRNCFKYYTRSMNEAMQERMKIDTAMHKAIENNELYVHFQPIMDTKNNGFVGAEALMRWTSAAVGMITPDKFIPIAEENGLIINMGRWILYQACQQAVGWPDNTFVTVNVSSVQFRHRDFARDLETILAETGLSPESLHLEITENVVMEDVEETIETIKQIVAMGVSLVIDDFGTGYSSLSYLTRFPSSILKIDRSFISRMIDDEDSAALVNAIIKMGHSLHMQIIAEGVETDQQLAVLRGQACDLIQGYYFSKPLPADALLQYIEEAREKSSV